MSAHPDPAIPPPGDLLQRLAARLAEVEREVRDLTNLINGGVVGALALVPTLPTPGRKGRVVILNVDAKLYRDDGSTWVAVG